MAEAAAVLGDSHASARFVPEQADPAGAAVIIGVIDMLVARLAECGHALSAEDRRMCERAVAKLGGRRGG